MSKYVSIDLETTGLNWETCQILSFGAVIEDRSKETPIEDLPKFHKIINRDFIKGEPYALSLNKDIIETIKLGKSKDLIYEQDLADYFLSFLLQNGYEGIQNTSWGSVSVKINVAGKNFNGFDKRFLEKVPDFLNIIRIGHRVLDPAPLYLEKDDVDLPNLQTCLDRAGIKTEVTHNALQDCIDVIKVLRHKKI